MNKCNSTLISYIIDILIYTYSGARDTYEVFAVQQQWYVAVLSGISELPEQMIQLYPLSLWTIHYT